MQNCKYLDCTQKVELTSDRTVPSIPQYTKATDKDGNVVNKKYIGNFFPSVIKTGFCRFHNLLNDGKIDKMK